MPILHYKTKEDVPAELQEVATQVTEDGDLKGQFAVNVVARKKLDEFRDNNTAMAAKLETAEQRSRRIAAAAGIANLEDFDAEEFSKEQTALRDTARKVADGKLQASDAIEAELSKRTEAMRSKYEQSLQESHVEKIALKGRVEKAESDYKRTFVDKQVLSTAQDPSLGLEPTALMDVLAKAYEVFVVEEDGSLTPREKSGATMWGEDGTSKMTMKEWIDLRLRKQAPHYFKKSNGGGAAGGAEAKFSGMAEKDFNALPAEQRLALANKQSFMASSKR